MLVISSLPFWGLQSYLTIIDSALEKLKNKKSLHLISTREVEKKLYIFFIKTGFDCKKDLSEDLFEIIKRLPRIQARYSGVKAFIFLSIDTEKSVSCT